MRFCGHCGASAALEAEPAAETGAVTDALRSFVAGPVADKLIESGGHVPEERRLITALFADVSGFTALADRLETEDLLEVIDPVISTLSAVVSRYEGYVEKFAGDALLALFGAPIAHEDDSSRALLVALEMHRELARISPALPHQADLTLHVGVNSGHGIARILGSEARMDYGVLGDAVILAQRLESAAPPGETYVSEPTFRLTRKHFDFAWVGDLTLKGKSEPVPAWRLLGQRSRPKLDPDESSATSFVGRRKELAAAKSALADAETGHGTVLTVVGEAGVGKSRLTREIRAVAATRGFRWLETRCLSYGHALPYWPYTTLLRGLSGARPDENPPAVRERLQAFLAAEGADDTLPFFARLLGLPLDGLERVAELEPEPFRRGLHDAFVRWLTTASSTDPVVLAIEDLHWIDAASLALTAELTGAAASHHVLVYATGRPDALMSVDGLHAAEGDDTRITLEPLDADAVDELLAALLPGSLPDGFAQPLFDRTRGNPFFVEEIVRSLKETNVLSLDAGVWRMQRGWNEAAVPTTVEGAVAARIDLLPPEGAGVLQTASVIGRRFRLPLLMAVEPSVASRPDVVAELVERGFLDRIALDDGADLVFHHAIVQEVAYARMLRRRRRDLHRTVADAAEALYGSGDEVLDLLARHLYLGEAGAKAIDYLVRAGRRARQLFANAEAIVHLERAAEVAAREPKLAESRADILIDLAELHELVGEYDRALDLYGQVRSQWHDVRAWRGAAAVLRKRGEYEQALEVVNDGFADSGLRDADLTPLWLEQGWILSVMGRFDQAIDSLEAALLNASGTRSVYVAQVLLQLARAETVEGRLESALERCFIAKAIFEELGDLSGDATTHRIVGDVYRSLGKLNEAEEWLRRGLEVAERTGSVEEIGGCLVNLALVEQQRGAYANAIEHNRRAIAEFERFGHASGRAQGYANLAWTLSDAGEFDEALEFCEKALELARSLGLSLTVADVYDTIASIELGRGDSALAGAKAEEAAALYLDLGAAPRAVGSLELAAKAWERAGDEERARTSRARARDLLVESAS